MKNNFKNEIQEIVKENSYYIIKHDIWGQDKKIVETDRLSSGMALMKQLYKELLPSEVLSLFSVAEETRRRKDNYDHLVQTLVMPSRVKKEGE